MASSAVISSMVVHWHLHLRYFVVVMKIKHVFFCLLCCLFQFLDPAGGVAKVLDKAPVGLHPPPIVADRILQL